MKDIQNQRDSRHIDIHKVGVKDLLYPVVVLDKNGRNQHTVARINMYVRLDHQFKGTHMSRFVEILNRFHTRLNLASCQAMLEEMKARLASEQSHLEITFPYFFASDKKSTTPLPCQCCFTGTLGQKLECALHLSMPLPASQNEVQVTLGLKRFLWLEDFLAPMQEAIITGAASGVKTTGVGITDVESINMEALCHQVGMALCATKGCRWLTVTAKEARGGYQVCTSRHYNAPTIQ